MADYKEARMRANAKYKEKTLKRYMFYFQKVDDADIIKNLESAKADGVSRRVWLRQLFEGKRYGS